VYC
jgi:hypothetical protein